MDYDPRDLRNAVLNIELYGEALPEELLESISKFGVREPLLVCRSDDEKLDMVVVSGRRRRMAAIKCGLKSVPCREIRLQSEDELNMELILHNVRTDLTTEQKARMYAALKGIQERLAESRMRAGKVSEEKATSRESAAKSVGLSPTTAERAKKVIEVVDELIQGGDEKGAGEIIEALNKSVLGAEKLAEKVQGKRENKSPPPMKWKRAVGSAVQKIESGMQGVLEGIKEMIKGLDAMQKEQPNQMLFRDMEALLTELGDGCVPPSELVKKVVRRWSQVK